jgi:hypothetical protein
MPKKKPYNLFSEKASKTQKEERKKVLSIWNKKDDIEAEKILKDFKEDFENENAEDLIFVSGGTFDVNKRSEQCSESKGTLYNLKKYEKSKEKQFLVTKPSENPQGIFDKRMNIDTLLEEATCKKPNYNNVEK